MNPEELANRIRALEAKLERVQEDSKRLDALEEALTIAGMEERLKMPEAATVAVSYVWNPYGQPLRVCLDQLREKLGR